MGLGSATRDATTDRWLPFRAMTGAGPESMPLYCLPHAGGGASAYRSWLGRLPGAAVLPLQPPGRETRYQEPPFELMAPLVEALADVVLADLAPVPAGRRFACYGHSLGALVAFELVRELRRRGGPQPAHLFVSGCVAPQCEFDDGPPVRGMSRAQVVEMLRGLGGTPDWLLADPSVLEMILPAVRADFSVKETYRYREEPPLAVPVTALASTTDPRASRELMARWQEQSTGRFTMHTLTGGHFAVFEQAAMTHRHVRTALSGGDPRAGFQIGR